MIRGTTCTARDQGESGESLALRLVDRLRTEDATGFANLLDATTVRDCQSVLDSYLNVAFRVSSTHTRFVDWVLATPRTPGAFAWRLLLILEDAEPAHVAVDDAAVKDALLGLASAIAADPEGRALLERTPA